LLRNSIEFVETYYACAKIGAVLVPVNWRLVAREIEYILNDSGASFLVYDQEFEGAVSAARSGCDALRHSLMVAPADVALAADTSNYDTLVNAQDAIEPDLCGGDDDLLFIMYTSGTTGNPKGVMQSHEGMLWAELTSMSTSDMRGDDRFQMAMPMFHVGCLVPVSQIVHRGACGVILRDIDMAMLFESIEKERVTITMSVPALLQFMLVAPEREQFDISSIRWIATGAAPVPVSLLHAYEAIGIVIYQAYGLTESGGPGTLLLPQDAEAKVGSCGKPQMHTEIRVVDGEGRDVEPGSGQVGELLLAGKHIMQGYWNKPEATAAALKGGWLYSGDLVTIDEDGFISICDRKKDMIISGGENIYPAELENVLAACPEVQEAAVIGVASERWGETPLAIIVPCPGTEPTEESIKAYCKKNLAAYKVPSQYAFVDALPRNPSGKLLKPKLREQYGQ
jgi:acyl-CoA synthetase (AMP-forming)/AMP-acid ligase II